MSNNWKKRVSDFFFEEIEVEIEEKKEQNGDPVYRSHPTHQKPVNTKVAYHYPKNNKAPFRFPVIPDEINQNRDQETIMQHSHHRHQQPIRKTRRPYNENMTFDSKHVQTFTKELEDVPAYVRRQQEREKLSKDVQKKEFIPQEDRQTETKNENRLDGYTRPHELDRVFRIRDGYNHEEEQDNQYEKIKKDDPIIPHRANRQAKLKALKEQRAQRGKTNDKTDHIATKETDETPIKTVMNVYNELYQAEDRVDVKSGDELDENIEMEQSVEMNQLDKDITVPNYLLDDPVDTYDGDDNWLQQQQHLLNQTFEHFKVDAQIVNVTQGPSVTRFEIQPALGVKVSRIRGLADDIKLNMAAKDIRMEAPIPGKHTIGIEIPNRYPQVVNLQEIVESDPFQQSPSDLTIALGLSIEGEPFVTTIDEMPHGLIAGATGSGKSVCINSIILSILYKAHYDDVKFMMIDPKMVELTQYNGIPHLISPVITDAKAATIALKWAVEEMESRYEKLAEAGVRNIKRYNEKMKKEQRTNDTLSYIVIVIDELADLMIVSPQEVEDAVCRIAQKARACGIHLLLATQRPSVDVITGLIKANIPTRIAFSVSSQVDSRTILDTNGAEKLLGKGDMLFIENGASKSVRLQGPFVSDDEIDRVANFTRQIAKPTYLFEQEQLLLEVENEDEDELLQEVISFVLGHQQASTSLLQRRFRIGYNRAARLIDSLEQKGIISSANGSKPRDVLVTKSQLNELFDEQ